MSLKKKRILVTYGPTCVAIDDMRVISNRSSGMMGKLIVQHLVKAGAQVTALEGPITHPLLAREVRVKKFQFFDEFAKLFTAEVKKKYDAVIHAAAVSDFKVRHVHRKKIDSGKSIHLTLVPTQKLISKVKTLAPKTFLVGFKLESTTQMQRLKEYALESIKTNRCDMVVANSMRQGYTGFIFNKDGKLLGRGKTRKTVSQQLAKYVLERCSCLAGRRA